jgi:hypothetical protein
MVQPEATDDNIIGRMRFVCWITKATDTHSEYVIFIATVLMQRLSVLRYIHIACPVFIRKHTDNM